MANVEISKMALMPHFVFALEQNFQMLASRARLIRISSSFCTKLVRRALSNPLHCGPKRPAHTMTMVNSASRDGLQANSNQRKMNAWQQPGPAAYDFRSDTI